MLQKAVKSDFIGLADKTLMRNFFFLDFLIQAVNQRVIQEFKTSNKGSESNNCFRVADKIS